MNCCNLWEALRSRIAEAATANDGILYDAAAAASAAVMHRGHIVMEIVNFIL
jgi:hypothetical protein